VKQQWFAVLLTFFLIIPITFNTSTTPESTIVVSDTREPALQRIYDEIVASEIYENITSLELRNIVRKFSENGSRFLQDAIEVDMEIPNTFARHYIIQQLIELSNGRIEIEVFGDYRNVLGKLPGYLPGDSPVFIVSAHYDTPEGCPGANCDGSGIAAMLTLARVMSQYEWPLDIYFMAFNGLYPHGRWYMDYMEGSTEVSSELMRREIETLAMFNIDTVLFPNPTAPIDKRVWMGYDPIGGYAKGRYWAELTRAMSNNYGHSSIVPVPSYSVPIWDLGDHYPFIHRGFSGVVCAFESGSSIDDAFQNGDDVYTQPGYDYGLLREVTAAIGSSMSYIMGRRYGEPRQIDFSLIIGSEGSEELYIPITTPTNIEVTCRWFGGPATFQLLNPNSQIIGTIAFDSASAWEYTDLFDIPVSDKGLYTLVLSNPGYRPVGFELTYWYESDIESNGILDSQEFWMDSSYFSLDQDLDGISAANELFIGTDDTKIDSDGDTMDDKFEVDNGLDPTDPSDGNDDADGDGLSNAQEYSLGLDMFSEDTDSDNMPDLWEVENELNPLVDDSMLDADGDGKSNLQEYLEDSDPQRIESEPIPVFWFILPLVVIAVIVGFLYLRKEYF